MRNAWGWLGSLAAVAVWSAQPFAIGQGLRLVSLPSEAPPATAGGDSYAPIVSRDGRFVLFASSANNLVTSSNNTALLPHEPPNLNVFLRDRASGSTTLVSINALGTGGGNGDSLPVNISTNGRYALFESRASDLVPGDTNKNTDVFLRDLQAGTTLLVSINTNGVAGNGESRGPAMTPDGRYVVFSSAANDLVTGDTNRIADVFIRDMQSGTTTLVSLGAISTNSSAPMGGSEAPSLSSDGRYVVFFSTATNLVSSAPPGGDVYVCDLVGGTTAWASSGARTLAQTFLNLSNVVSYNPSISDDGQYVAFQTSSPTGALSGLILRYTTATANTDVVHTNATVGAGLGEDIRSFDMTPDGRFIAFVANTNGPRTTCVMLWDAQTGVATLVSGDVTSNQVQSNTACFWPTLDASGQFVAFLSTANILNSNSFPVGYHLYLRDMTGGPVLINAGTNSVPVPLSASARPSLSADAGAIAFECGDGSLVPNDRNHDSDVFVRNVQTNTTELVSAHHPLLPTVTPNGLSSLRPGCSSVDGRYVVFASDADNLLANDTNGCRDVFIRDRLLATNFLISVATNGGGGDGFSLQPVISSDGRYVAFTSVADNLAANDTNGVADVFVRDMQAGATVLISQNSGGGSGNAASSYPTLSLDGQYLLFRSKARNISDLSAGSFTSGLDNLFMRDMQTGTNYGLTTAGVISAGMTPDGRYVAFVDSPGMSSGKVYVWSALLHARVATNSAAAGVSLVGISPDGSKLVYWAGSSLVAADWIAHTNWTLASGTASAPKPRVGFSASGRFLAYTADNTNQVYLFDFQTATNVLVSHASGAPTVPGDSASDLPDMSPDGRFIAYRSTAGNLVAGDTNGVPNLVLYDCQTGSNTLLTASLAGGASSNNRSFAPSFSEDGRMLFFQSAASDLANGDFNQGSDLFAFAFFYVTLSQSYPNPGTTLSWPFNEALNYSVQFRDNLGDPNWQQLNATITNMNGTAWLQDNTAGAGQRFYRVRAY